MNSPYIEPAYALIVAAAAWVWPPLALAVAALYLIVIAIINDRRAVPEVRE
jgi:hypothetical protein